MISEEGQACICGLRYSCNVVKSGKWQRTIYAFPKSTKNNLKWLSPELLQQDLHGYNEKSDIYSLGMTLCELANGEIPFADVPETLMLTEKVQGHTPKIIDKFALNDVMDIEPSKFNIYIFKKFYLNWVKWTKKYWIKKCIKAKEKLFITKLYFQALLS